MTQLTVHEGHLMVRCAADDPWRPSHELPVELRSGPAETGGLDMITCDRCVDWLIACLRACKVDA